MMGNLLKVSAFGGQGELNPDASNREHVFEQDQETVGSNNRNYSASGYCLRYVIRHLPRADQNNFKV